MAEIVKCSVCGKDCKNLAVHMRKHKDEKKDVIKATRDGETSSLEVKMDAMISGLNTVAGALGKLVELQTSDKKEESNKHPDTSFVPKIDDETYPDTYIPAKFRKIVDDILSPEFGIKIDNFDDRTDFQVNIIVPSKYSSLAKEEKEAGVQDIRSRMIPRALGENGVRDWCTMIRKNLAKYYQKEGVGSPFKEMAA